MSNHKLTLYRNRDTGQYLSYAEMRAEWRDMYDGDDPTNIFTWRDQYDEITTDASDKAAAYLKAVDGISADFAAAVDELFNQAPAL